MARAIRNIIFDWSGTLVDDLPAVWRATNHVFCQSGLPELTLEEFRREFSLPFVDFYKRFIPHVSIPQLECWFHGHYPSVQCLVSLLPHAKEFLDFCTQSKIRLFLLSSIHQTQYTEQAPKMGLDRYFEHAYVQVLDKRLKIREILSDHGLDATETLFIGDMQHDIETARHGGVHSCAVLTGYNNKEQLQSSHPDLIVQHLAELRIEMEKYSLHWPYGSNHH